MVDINLLNRLITFMESQLQALRQLAIPSQKAFAATHHLHKTVLHDLQELIQACIDIGNHIIADEGFRAPENYRDVFRILEEEKVITPPLCKKLEQMVGFRNIVVHLYERVDLETVYAIFKRRLGDFTQFIQAIRRLVRRQSKR